MELLPSKITCIWSRLAQSGRRLETLLLASFDKCVWERPHLFSTRYHSDHTQKHVVSLQKLSTLTTPQNFSFWVRDLEQNRFVAPRPHQLRTTGACGSREKHTPAGSTLVKIDLANTFLFWQFLAHIKNHSFSFAISCTGAHNLPFSFCCTHAATHQRRKVQELLQLLVQL